MTKWIDKIFIVDTVRDYRFNVVSVFMKDIDEKTMKCDIKEFYRPAVFLGSLSTVPFSLFLELFIIELFSRS